MELILHSFELSDASNFLEWAGDDEVTKYLRWETFTSQRSYSFPPLLPSNLLRGPCRGVHIHLAQLGINARGEIAYAIKTEYWGMGVATQAVKMAVKQASHDMKFLDRVEGLVFVENKASQRVLLKAGFHKEGILRELFFVKGESKDIVVFSVVRRDF